MKKVNDEESGRIVDRDVTHRIKKNDGENIPGSEEKHEGAR